MKILVFDPLIEKYFVADCKREKRTVVVTLYNIFGGRFIDSHLIGHMDEICIPGVVDEKFIFDFAKGKVFIQVTGSDTHQFVFCRNISAPGEIYKTDLPLLLENSSFREDIIQLFTEAWGQPLPYNSQNITTDKLVLMTMFTGYSARFYDALPIDMKTGCICDEYSNLAVKLHRAADIVPLVNKAAIPQTKGVKKIIYQNEALVFYIPLLEWMWSISDGNAKDFVSCLDIFVRYNYEPLVYLASRSEDVKNSISKFIQSTGLSLFNVVMIIRRYPEYMLYYTSLSDTRKKKEEETVWKKIKKTSISYNMFETSQEIISRPLLYESENYDIYTTGHFSFVPCNTLEELRTAGAMLRNCMQYTEDPEISFDRVFRVYRYNKLVGAVEITYKKIVQYKAADNKEISTVPGFSEALKEFAQKNELEYYNMPLRQPHYNHCELPADDENTALIEDNIFEYEHLLEDLLL